MIADGIITGLGVLAVIAYCCWLADRDMRRRIEQTSRPTDGVTGSTTAGRCGANQAPRRSAHPTRESAGCNRRSL